MINISGNLQFDGLNSCITLVVDQRFYDALQIAFPHWPFSITDAPASTVFATIVLADNKYTLSSPFMEEAKSYDDPVNTICALIVELAWARLREDTKLLCLHGAAVEINGRLLVFPSTRRAGKSTLSVAMAAAGNKVFTDDFLPLQISKSGQIFGLASGISPRLRLPAPQQLGKTAQEYIKDRRWISNRQYQYIAPFKDHLAHFGDTAPIGGLIFLDRKDGVKATLSEVSQSETLKTLVMQNFSRAINAGSILKMLQFIAGSAPSYTLEYDATEDAIQLLEHHFKEWKSPPPAVKGVLGETFFSSALNAEQHAALDISAGPLMQAKGITEISSDGKNFLSGQNGKSIHYLNDGAATIWRLLAEPVSVEEIIEILCAVFPEHPAEDIKRDVLATVGSFARNGLLMNVDKNCNTDGFAANLPAESVNPI